ncbi:MAG: hypothetical protein ACRCUE_19135 [Bosea sp. (in: a-proteobacteria)]
MFHGVKHHGPNQFSVITAFVAVISAQHGYAPSRDGRHEGGHDIGGISPPRGAISSPYHPA